LLPSIDKKSIPYYLVGLAIFLYATYRSVIVGITHDEVYTYLIYVPLSVWETISYNPIYNANNHILNTLLMKVSCGLFGDAEWALRLPNTLGHLLYVVFSIKLARTFFPNVFICLLAVLILNANPYMLDFFSVARGYGLGMGCMMVSIYYFLRHLNKPKQTILVCSLIWAILSVWSNFINVLFFVAIVATYGLVHLDSRLRTQGASFTTFWRSQIPSITASAVLSALIYYPIRQLQKLDEFRYGGDSSFYKDTYQGLLRHSLYNEGYLGKETADYLNILLMFVITAAIIILVVSVMRNRVLMRKQLGLVVLLILGLIALASIVQHHMMDVAYLQDRRTIIFLPFVGLVVLFSLNTLSKLSLPIANLLAIIISLMSAYHLIRTTRSMEGIREWYYDENTKEVMALIAKDNRVIQNDTVSLTATWTMKNSCDFYQQTQNLHWLKPLSYKSQDFGTSGYDYYYLYESEKDRVIDSTEQVFYENGRVLLKRIER